jgi:hypothetical protein
VDHRSRPSTARIIVCSVPRKFAFPARLGREDDWRACLDQLIDRHRSKYKLRPLL